MLEDDREVPHKHVALAGELLAHHGDRSSRVVDSTGFSEVSRGSCYCFALGFNDVARVRQDVAIVLLARWQLLEARQGRHITATSTIASGLEPKLTGHPMPRTGSFKQAALLEFTTAAARTLIVPPDHQHLAFTVGNARPRLLQPRPALAGLAGHIVLQQCSAR
jgi:hypothetical protein